MALQDSPSPSAPGALTPTAWSPTTRVAFRFFFLYFTLWCFGTQVVGGLLQVPGHFFPALGPIWPMADLTQFTSQFVFGADAPFERGNSADTLFWWAQTVWMLALEIGRAHV